MACAERHALRLPRRRCIALDSTGRLKGKARKQARDAAKANSGQPANRKPRHTINVSDFTLMAGAIAEFKPAVKIPTALDNLFSRVIEARQLFSDCTHLQGEAPSPSTGPTDEPSVHLANRFSGLHVETSSEQNTAAETAAQPDESDYVLENVVLVAIVKSEEDIEDDFFLAIHSFMLDLHDLRDSLRYRYWSSYRKTGSNELTGH
ncbi:hypothetical protein NUW58_g3180 [Xylaria curta]|uniref:Uncharacterized protein n=1 Tax=Xylaria curta TaxID=42375 RepID=A0ACC1PC64_9PEZI|nr:hypothetical protein NUW58_g3180 [Xylaria curta]